MVILRRNALTKFAANLVSVITILPDHAYPDVTRKIYRIKVVEELNQDQSAKKTCCFTFHPYAAEHQLYTSMANYPSDPTPHLPPGAMVLPLVLIKLSDAMWCLVVVPLSSMMIGPLLPCIRTSLLKNTLEPSPSSMTTSKQGMETQLYFEMWHGYYTFPICYYC